MKKQKRGNNKLLAELSCRVHFIWLRRFSFPAKCCILVFWQNVAQFATFLFYLTRSGNNFAKISKIHNTIFIRYIYLLVFRAKSRLEWSQPKSAKGKCFLSDFGDLHHLRRLSVTGDSLESFACTDNGNVAERAFCDNDGWIRGGFSGRQNGRNCASDVVADARQARASVSGVDNFRRWTDFRYGIVDLLFRG